MRGHVTDRLSAYLDGALGAGDLVRVQAHLETCPVCVREYEEFRALRGLLRALPEPALPEGLAGRVRLRLERDAGRWRGAASVLSILWPPSLPRRLALAAVALVLVSGLPLSRMMHATERPLDSDAYVRTYLTLSADRTLTDETTATLIASNVAAPAPRAR